MSEKKYQIHFFNKIEKDSDFSDREYKSNILQKYEKFKPKNSKDLSDNLKGAENQVKNLLSVFLKNFEKKNKNSLSRYNKSYKKESISNNQHSSNNSFDKNKIVKKEKKSINSTNKVNDNDSYYDGTVQKSKVRFSVNSIKVNNQTNNRKSSSILSGRKTKRNSAKNVCFKIHETTKLKQKFNALIKKTKTIDILKRNRKDIQIKRKDNNINNISVDKKNFIELNRTNSQIKRTNSFKENYTYLNFKKDILNRSNKDKSIAMGFAKKKKKGILNNKNRIKNEILNDSSHNSILSDFSDNNLKNISLDITGIKNNIVKKKSNNISTSNHRISLNIPKMNKKRINSIENLDLSSKNNSFLDSIRSKKSINNKLDLKKTKDNKFKRVVSNDNDQKLSNYQRLNSNYKSLKDQLKKTLVLRPEELEISSIQVDLENNSINNKSFLSKSLFNNVNKRKKSNYFEKTKSEDMINGNKKSQIINNYTIRSKSNNITVNANINSNNSDLKQSLIELKKNKTSNDSDSLAEPVPKINQRIMGLEKNNSNNKKETSKITTFEDLVDSNKIKNISFSEKFRVLTHKKMVYDSLDDDELEDEEEINILYLNPNSTFIIFFDSILLLFTFLSFIELPLYLAMNHNFCKDKVISVTFSINFISEVLNILDLFFGFFRAYYNWEEQLINKHKKIILKYITEWFIFDFMASIPVYTLNKLYEPICKEKASYYSAVLNNLHYSLILIKLIKVLKVFLHNQAWNRLSNKLNEYGSIIVYICLVIAAINYVACFFIFIGRNSYPNWIIKSKLDTEPFFNIYICSIYALTTALTTVGYGDITCYSLSERLFLLLILNIGIIAYSLVVSFFSNYIKKINEESIDFENKKYILDEIRLSHPNMSDNLYDRILRYLKFKNYNEKKIKNIIFDCLPVGLKNDLVLEMYKPIITNFIFFKNFQNKDFIVRVVLSFKPIIAYKNDLLVNDGDMVEEIIFVKKGMLTVELPINMVNQRENIDKYLKSSLINIKNLQKFQKNENQPILKGKNLNIKTIRSLKEKDLKKNSSLSKKKNQSNDLLTNYSNRLTKLSIIEKERKEREEELQKKKDITYVKIIGIRENEHFGDVLMFLEQRSPLRIRVKTEKCELFFLKKIDAIKISSHYQNIWKTINKKSIFNFEQIKKIIKNIVEVYCSIKTYKNNTELMPNNKLKKLKKKIYDMENTSSKITLKSRKSLSVPKVDYTKFFKGLDINNELIKKKLNNNKKNCFSEGKIERKRKMVLNLTNMTKTKTKLFFSSSSSFFSSELINSSSSSSNNTTNEKKKIKKRRKKKFVNNKINHQKIKYGEKVVDAFNFAIIKIKFSKNKN